MKDTKIFGIPIVLWLFPPVALFILAVNAVKSVSSKDDEEKKDG